jgi:hypothetical protein
MSKGGAVILLIIIVFIIFAVAAWLYDRAKLQEMVDRRCVQVGVSGPQQAWDCPSSPP